MTRQKSDVPLTHREEEMCPLCMDTFSLWTEVSKLSYSSFLFYLLSLSLVCIESLYWRLEVLPMDQHLKTSMNRSNVKNSDQSSSTVKQQTGNITELIMRWTLLCPEWGTNSLSHDCMSMCVETKSYTLYCQKYFIILCIIRAGR